MFHPSDLTPFVNSSRARGRHRAGFLLGDYAMFSKRWMEKYNQAERYGKRLIKRWTRLYEAKVRYVEKAK